MDRPAIILVDVQNDFVSGSMKVDSAKSIIVPLQRLITTSHLNNIPVIYSVDAHYPQDVEVTMKWGKHALKGTEGAQVISELQPDPTKDYIVEKRTYSGFFETGLDSLLRTLYKGDGAKTVVLGGLHTQLCVRHTAADAFFRGYRLVVVKDGVEAFTKEDQEQGLKYLEYVYGARILPVDEVIWELVR
ncbi:MAG TPA: isochorismatase family cysteine hydrolase [Candidatus Acidoferrales bacterium]|nr:isochorismatase family cysteine hydrolase [Candidatus Acidoferrales bacterium]